MGEEKRCWHAFNMSSDTCAICGERKDAPLPEFARAIPVREQSVRMGAISAPRTVMEAIGDCRDPTELQRKLVDYLSSGLAKGDDVEELVKGQADADVRAQKEAEVARFRELNDPARLRERLDNALHFERIFRQALADIADALKMPGAPHLADDVPGAVAKAVADRDALRAQVATMERRYEHTQEWFGSRMERLRKLAEEHGLLDQFCNIAANGTAHVMEPHEPLWSRLRARVATYEQDAKEAAGELMLELPEPGSVMAKLMIVNRLLKYERDAAEAEAHRLRELFDDAGQGEHNVLALIDHYQDEAREAYERGVSDERSAVVAWLRIAPEAGGLEHYSNIARNADCIERGDHVKQEGGQWVS